jgi:hypothetical protein
VAGSDQVGETETGGLDGDCNPSWTVRVAHQLTWGPVPSPASTRFSVLYLVNRVGGIISDQTAEDFAFADGHSASSSDPLYRN